MAEETLTHKGGKRKRDEKNVDHCNLDNKKVKINNNIFEDPDLVSKILSHLNSNEESRKLFRDIRLVNKTLYDLIDFNLIEPFFFTDFEYIHKRYDLELIPSNLPIIKCNKPRFRVSEKFAINYIIEMVSRFNNTNKDLYSNMDKYLRYFFGTPREIRHYEQFVKNCKSPLLISIVIDFLTSGSYVKFEEISLDSYSVINMEFTLKLIVHKLNNEPLSKKFYENFLFRFLKKPIQDCDLHLTQLIQVEDIQPHLEKILLNSLDDSSYNLTYIKDIKFFKVIAQSRSVSFDSKKKIFKTLLKRIGDKFRMIPMLRLYVTIHKEPPNLNKYLIKFFESYYIGHPQLIRSLLNDVENVISPQCFPADQDLKKCFEICLQKETFPNVVVSIFSSLVNRTMFAQTTTRKFCYSVIFSSLFEIQQSHLDILRESLVANEREDLLLFSDEPCEMVANCLKSEKDLEYYLKLFPNLNLLRVGLVLFSEAKDSLAHKVFDMIQKKCTVDQDIVDEVIQRLYELGDCYDELEFFSTYPVLRKPLKKAVDAFVQEDLDGEWDYSKKLKKMIEEEDCCLENQLYRDNEFIRFGYDIEEYFVKAQFTPKALAWTFKGSAPYAKTKACSFLHTFIDKRDEVRSIKIAHSQILPDKLTISFGPTPKELSNHDDIRKELEKLRDNEIFQNSDVINFFKTFKSDNLTLVSDDKDSVTLLATSRFKFSENQSPCCISWKFLYVRSQLSSLTIEIV